VNPGQDSFWARLGPAERKAIEQVSTRRRYRAGDYLCHEGDQTRYVIIVLSGHVRVLGHSVDGREIIFGVRAAGEVVGESAALNDSPRSATLQALDDVEAITLPGSRFTALCQAQAKLSWALLLVVSKRNLESSRKHTEFGSGNASSRVFAQLVDMALTLGRRNGTGTEIRSRSTQHQLAESLAISRESYARALRSLRERGVISTGRGWVLIHDLDELKRLAR
jgi:CRP-like cAMP-binding protein